MDSDPGKTESLSISQIFGGYLASCLVFPSSRRYVYPLELRNMPKISSTFVLQENSNTLRRSMVESYLSLNFKMRSISNTDPLPHSLNQNGLGIHISTIFEYFFSGGKDCLFDLFLSLVYQYTKNCNFYGFFSPCLLGCP